MLIIVSYVFGGVIGVEVIGFSYWCDFGVFMDGFCGVVLVFVFCSIFYVGVEFVVVVVIEIKNFCCVVLLVI